MRDLSPTNGRNPPSSGGPQLEPSLLPKYCKNQQRARLGCLFAITVTHSSLHFNIALPQLFPLRFACTPLLYHQPYHNLVLIPCGANPTNKLIDRRAGFPFVRTPWIWTLLSSSVGSHPCGVSINCSTTSAR